jgi:transcriptional regulator with XRE-family HTH domain
MMEKHTVNGDSLPDDPELEAFARRLKKAMAAAEHTRVSLGRSIDAHHNTVGHWTRANRWPQIGHLGRLAVALNVSVDWLLTGREPAASHKGATPDNAHAVQLAREFSDLAPQLSGLAKRARKVVAGS